MEGGAQAPEAGAADRRLWLARHGQTAYNLEGRFQGWLPVPLDAIGRRQAADLAEVVARLAPAALVCSDIARAQETAAIVGARTGIEPVVDARFAETGTGDWTDRAFADVIAEDPEGFARFAALDLDWGFPGGETFAHQRARVLDGLADWHARGIPGHVVIVCHGNTIRLATLGAGGVPDADRPDNGSLVGL
jgi:probable phosphoglycerate mutase